MMRHPHSQITGAAVIARAVQTTAFRVVILATAIFLGIHAALAQDPGVRTVDGLTVYFGVMPSEIVRGHPQPHAERSMHGGSSGREHTYHMVIAVFDDVTGARLTDVTVKAKVRPPSRPTITIPLEKMDVAGTTTYGNFFPVAGYGTYRLSIEVYQTNVTQPVIAEFTYEHRLK